MAVTTVRDVANAAWIGPQASNSFSTPAVVMCWLTAPPRFRVQRALAKPRLQRLTRWDHIEEYEIGEEVTITLEKMVDTHEHGFINTSVHGKDSYASSTHTWLPGALTGSIVQILLSMMITHGGYDIAANQWEAYKFRNVRFTEDRWRFDPGSGMLMSRSTATGIYDGKVLVANPTFPTASNPLGAPLINAGVVFSRNASVVSPILSGELIFRNSAKPVIGSPAVAGTGAIKPTRFTEGAQGGSADIIYDSVTDLNASFDDYLTGTTAAWALVATAGSEVLTVQIPRIKYDTGELDPGNDDLRQHVGGDWLYQSTGPVSGSGVLVTQTGGRTSTYNT